MTKLAKGNPKRIERKATIRDLRLSGKSMADIATALHIAKSTVWKDLQDSDVKAAIEDTVKYLSTFSPLVYEGHVELLASNVPEVRQRAIELWYKLMSMLGAQQSIYIQNMYATQNNVILPEHMQRLLAQGPGEVINVTPYEDTSKTKRGNQLKEDITEGELRNCL